MKAVRTKNTKPELVVRRLLTKLGFRYRLHRKDLPGCPDIVFVRMRKAIFVNGCFWHGHDCRKGLTPDIEYWRNKINRNLERDAKNITSLKESTWSVLTIWECELKDEALLTGRLLDFLIPPN